MSDDLDDVFIKVPCPQCGETVLELHRRTVRRFYSRDFSHPACGYKGPLLWSNPTLADKSIPDAQWSREEPAAPDQNNLP